MMSKLIKLYALFWMLSSLLSGGYIVWLLAHNYNESSGNTAQGVGSVFIILPIVLVFILATCLFFAHALTMQKILTLLLGIMPIVVFIDRPLFSLLILVLVAMIFYLAFVKKRRIIGT